MCKTPVCGICWTNSWQPCEEGTPNSVKDGEGWMVCGYCTLQDYIQIHSRIPMSEYKKRLLELAERARRDEVRYWINDMNEEVQTDNKDEIDELVMLINKLENYPND